MQQKIKQAISNSRTDYTEIRFEEEQKTYVQYRRNQLENLESSEETGGMIRCLVAGNWGIVSFSSLDNLSSKIQEAQKIAQSVSKFSSEKVSLAKTDFPRETVRANLEKDFRRVSLKEKQKIAKRYDEILLNRNKEIISTNTTYSDSFRKIIIANSEGLFVEQEIPDVTLLLMAQARGDNGNIQQAHESVGSASGLEIVENKQNKAREVSDRAVNLLRAKPVEGGNYTVILNPELAGIFIHEAFGHLCEADHIYKNDKLKQMMTLGSKFGNPDLNVVDEGFIKGERGNTPYDDEGVKRTKTYLIRNGVLNSFLHSRETAAKMDQSPTGNARAISSRHEPIVRMTNTYIENGSDSPAEMFQDVDRGIYALDAFGGQTQLEQFTFSAAYAFEIHDGDFGPMVKDVVLTGNVFKTLKNIEKIGNDFDLKGGSGGCGKGGQNGLPVTFGAPHIMLKNVTIGGK